MEMKEEDIVLALVHPPEQPQQYRKMVVWTTGKRRIG
jgi:hypothetical protein